MKTTNKKNRKKVFLILIAAIEIILINAWPAYAISIPSPTDVMRDIEERYHLNRESIQEQGETFNVGEQKALAPQVMLYFTPTDPKPGEKLTADALPIYFGNPKEKLYYTWYLKHDNCDKDYSPGSDERDMCDLDDDGDITENDWKIEAMRTIANSGFDTQRADYGGQGGSDGDGYDANWGGDDREDMPHYCYVHDFESGVNYELNGASNVSFSCLSGTAKCVKNEDLVCSDDSGLFATFEEYQVCAEVGTPACVNGNALCTNGVPRCVGTLADHECSDPPSDPAASCAEVTSGIVPTCSSTNSGSGENNCRHLFPEYNDFNGSISSVSIDLDDEEVGDGSFGAEEEAFWKTSPQDPDTADNGNMDEANVTGLGVSSFSWNYQPGDKVGVAVEGTAMISTKHNDSSMMIMWALPKNECPVENTGSYSREVKGYNVNFPTANMDLNECLEDNLVDPTEGGQPKKINVTLSYLPDVPTNDPSDDQMGDTLVVNATTDDAGAQTTETYYEWNVELSPNGTFNSATDWLKFNITDELIDEKLIGQPVKGNNLPSLAINLNLNAENLDLDPDVFNNAFPGGIGYLRITALLRENFASGVSREGRGEVMVRVISSGDKISAHLVGVGSDGRLESNSIPICQDPVTDKTSPICFVLKNEIISVGISDSSGELDNFAWTLNGNPLTCDLSISGLCSDEKQTNYNFFPVTGNPGENYVVTVSANNVTSGKTIQLVRNFRVVEPFVKIVSADTNLVWPRYLGEYVNLENNDTFIDSSSDIFETFSGNDLPLQAEFHPSWLSNFLPDGFLKTQWTININGIEEVAFPDNKEISLPGAEKPIGTFDNVAIEAVFSQPPEIRRALKNLFNISQFESTEINMNHSIQVETVPAGTDDVSNITQNPGKFLASLVSNLPSQINFLFRIVLTIFVIILTTKIVFSSMPEPYEENKNHLQ
jgi:hypothetical protein